MASLAQRAIDEEHHLEEIAKEGYEPATLPIMLGVIVAVLTVIVGIVLGIALLAYYLS